MPVKRDEFLTLTEAAQVLRCTRRTIYTYLHDGKLKGCKPGGTRWLISQSELDRFMARGH